MGLKPILIGISGHKQTGKDTIYKFINSIFPMEHKFFGENLKIVAASLLNCDYRNFELEKFKNSKSVIKKLNNDYYTNREILQLLGTDICRVISSTIWIDLLFSDFNKDCNWVITDVRFPNEAWAIKDRGGKLIRVERNTNLIDHHISETALDDFTQWDRVIDNNGTLEELKDQVSDYMTSFL